MYVYKITNLVNGKIYIGKDGTRTDRHVRWYYHQWAPFQPQVNDYNKRLYRAIRKYGLDNFQYVVLEHIENDSKLLSEREIYFIKKYNTCDPKIGYNAAGIEIKYTDRKRKTYKIRNPNGEISETSNLPLFCFENDLPLGRMYHSASNKGGYRVDGWSCAKLEDEFEPFRTSLKGYKHKNKRKINSTTNLWTLVNPFGQEIQVIDLKKFCFENELNYRSMMRVNAGERLHHKNWKIKNRKRIKDAV